MDFIIYQKIRQKITDINSFKLFKEEINKYKLNNHLKLGLIREFRAYYWLSKKYKNDLVKISTSLEDREGIDIIIYKKKSLVNKIYFAVSGFADKEIHNNCNYKIIVGKDKIYQKKL